MSGAPRSNLGLVPRDMNGSLPVSTTNSSGPSIGVSSLVTDGNSSLSGGAQFQQSTSMNADSFTRLPASPMSFSSNNISGSSVIDGSIMQQSPPQEQMQKRRASSVTSQPVIDAAAAFHAQKKPRVDIRQDDILQQQLIQQLLQGQSSLHLQGQHNPQLQALIRQHKLAQIQQQQQHQLSQQFPQHQHSQVGIPRQPQLRPPLAQPGIQLAGPVRTPVESGLCSRRLMQYLYHKRYRPDNNPITYWRKLIDEYFAPRSRERWCVSSYEKPGNTSAAIPQTSPGTWRCDICNTHSGKGYEATSEILPRLCQIRFDHGVKDEYLFLDMPNEYRLPNGLLLLEHAKVVQKSIYEHQHVTHEGQLRIIFTPELKIMSWEFCSRKHDEYVTRKFLTDQVTHMLRATQNYQATVTKNGPAGLSNDEAQNACNQFASASRQLAKNIDHHSLNEHGLSKRYVRCLQISEVVNHMKDLIEFSHKNKLGPIEGLKNYPKQTAGPKLTVQNLHDSKAVKTEISPHVNNEVPGVGAISNNPQNPAAQSNYQHMLRSSSANQLLQQEASQNAAAMNSYQNMFRSSSANQGLLQQEASQNAAALNNYQNMLRGSSPNQSLLQQEASSTFKGPTAVHSGIQLEASRSFRAAQLGQFQHPMSFQQGMPQHQHNNFQGLGASPQFQQHVINQLLQEAKNTNSRALAHQQSPSTPNANGGLASGAAVANIAASGEQAQHMNNGAAKGAVLMGMTGPSNLINSGARMVQRSSSFKSVSSNPAASGGNAATPKAESVHDMDDLEHLISHELVESGLFMGEQLGDGGFSWNI
uniref:Transcriptional corepressor SEUSS n=1 Tax=Aegilops tauschii subsp. strangulata TaxID=200361 RepID=A0A453QXJ0_AEGTS